eukprot:scpid90591/ scgid33862/ 
MRAVCVSANALCLASLLNFLLVCHARSADYAALRSAQDERRHSTSAAPSAAGQSTAAAELLRGLLDLSSAEKSHRHTATPAQGVLLRRKRRSDGVTLSNEGGAAPYSPSLNTAIAHGLLRRLIRDGHSSTHARRVARQLPLPGGLDTKDVLRTLLLPIIMGRVQHLPRRILQELLGNVKALENTSLLEDLIRIAENGLREGIAGLLDSFLEMATRQVVQKKG